MIKHAQAYCIATTCQNRIGSEHEEVPNQMKKSFDFCSRFLSTESSELKDLSFAKRQIVLSGSNPPTSLLHSADNTWE
ncbi:hypothetical protein L484_009054 [Morus notabilis]|uniref:Uncharacterized protein n=1 Tax=Morus notabilis TaxID=981085 RepID=W9RB00_9ROSA|nr:hypothetical protein L484_009054 [Morus notabilis]